MKEKAKAAEDIPSFAVLEWPPAVGMHAQRPGGPGGPAGRRERAPEGARRCLRPARSAGTPRRVLREEERPPCVKTGLRHLLRNLPELQEATGPPHCLLEGSRCWSRV